MKLRLFQLCLGALLGARVLAAAPDLAALWQERLKSVVAVEFFTETEIDRRPVQTFGTVIDDQGTIIFPSQAISDRLTPAQLKDFRVYLPGQPTTHFLTATYLGHDEYTDWEFIRIDDARSLKELVPITHYAVAPTPGITDELWGIGLRKKDEDFAPYFMSSRVSILQRLPQLTALTAQEVAGLNLPVFDRNGAFVGLTIGGFGQTFLQFSARDRGGLPVVMINPDECAAVVLASEILPYLQRIPQKVDGRPLAWLGANGLQPLDPEVASYLHLEKQAGLVVSEVLDDSPAAAAGLRERDIILSVDGQPLPVLKPDRVLITWFQREVDRRRPGDVMKLGLQRDKQRVDIAVKLADAPQLPREAPRHYFENLGLTVRAFTFSDGVVRRLKGTAQSGVIAHFVKVNAPVSVAGLRTDDWIKEIDGTPISSFTEAVKLLAAIENDPTRSEFVLLVDRGGETSVLRVKLK
jgi:serine protease Do